MHCSPPCKPHIAIIAVDVSQSVDLDQGACRDLRCTLRVTAAGHDRAHLLQHDRRSDLWEPAMPTTNVTKKPLTYLAAFALLAGPLAAKKAGRRVYKGRAGVERLRGGCPDSRAESAINVVIQGKQGGQKAEIYFDPDTHVVTVQIARTRPAGLLHSEYPPRQFRSLRGR